MAGSKERGEGGRQFRADGRVTRLQMVLTVAVLAAAALAVLWFRRRPTVVLRPGAAGPAFVVPEASLSHPLKIIAYGDMRFTDPHETTATNPKVRRWLVDQIAAEKPDAVLLSGDVPWRGGEAADYDVYRSETSVWREAHLRIYPALGNHEFHGVDPIATEQKFLQNWWNAFPELRGVRWYAVELGNSVYILNLDSNSSLVPGSPQIAWLQGQLAHLPATVRFVFFNLHHPPVVDFQENGDASHNGRPNEKALADFLAQAPGRQQARFMVAAGHIHNYERFYQDGIVYLVSGGGGAKPRPIVRGPADLYQDTSFPNYHYVKFVQDGDGFAATMVRVADPDASAPSWQEKDHFEVDPAQTATAASGLGRAAHH
jgi:acid phosphatase type 7